ncbi:hypothetical protein TSUD_23960 [Trifolium subterraneum]|uniref:Uncharacterized protein n=1 Tax=Trifolium subterraneum TaxID=3900 RepID=A0A2Z6PGW9_TRISU|nr:hypothetical protein TSUD_23960 [Trifolium subterraneum]
MEMAVTAETMMMMNNNVLCLLTNPDVSVEKALPIVCQPQAIFRVRPVNSCSAAISAHADSVLTVAFSPDGKHLASGSGDRTVRFWDINTQTPLFTCKGHDSSVLFVAWSPDGKYLVSGSESGELICWDPQTGKSLGNFMQAARISVPSSLLPQKRGRSSRRVSEIKPSKTKVKV